MLQIIALLILVLLALMFNFVKLAIIIITLYIGYILIILKQIDDIVYTSNITDDVRFFSLLKKFNLNQEEMNHISDEVTKEKFSQEEIQKYKSKLRKLGYFWI